jgi:mannose/fructose/N-acetylgalactosamine-specific phosphotransferase system component IIC
MTDAIQASPLAGAVFADSPLSATHRHELAAARDRAKSIRKAARVAGFNGWTTAAAAAFSGMFLLFDRSALSIAITLGLSIVAYVEFRGRKQLLNFDPSAATMLGWNQLGLLAMIIAYCVWMLCASSSEAVDAMSSQMDSVTKQEMLNMVGDLEGLYKTATLAMYGGVIVLSVLFQGGNAIYYFTRRRHVEDFIAETPQWVRDVQGGSIPA